MSKADNVPKPRKYSYHILSIFFPIFALVISLLLALNYSNSTLSNELTYHKHKLGVVVPFRDRFDELLLFVPYISKFLKSQSIDFKIIIANQVDEFRFNRASLINAGFLEAMNDCDYMVMHDVDLIPINTKLNYSFPAEGAYHVSAPGLHPNYDYKTFVGGILIISKKDFIKTNGNLYMEQST